MLLIMVLVVSLNFICSCQNDGSVTNPHRNPERLNWRWVVKPEEYEDLFLADKDLIAVKNKKGKFGVINLQGEAALPFEYEELSPFYEGLAVACKNGKTSYINKRGAFITDKGFEAAYRFQEAMGAVRKNNMWGFLDLSGNLAIGFRYDDVKLFCENLAAVRLNGKWGFINKGGEFVVENRFEEVQNFKESRAAVKLDGKWGFTDTRGTMITACIYDEVHDFQEGYAAVRKNGKWGFIDKEGRECIAFLYDDAGDFSENKAAVKIEALGSLGKWGYIDKKGAVVIDFYPYDAADDRMIYVGEFHNGIAFVSKAVYCIIDAEGNNVFSGASEFFISSLVYNPEYDVIPGYVFTDDKMTVRKYGLMGLDGGQRLEPVFDYIDELNGAYVIVSNMIHGEYRKGLIELVKA